jgi:hypothetical protein
MTIDQAQRVCRAYQQLLADDEKRGGRRSPSLLPVPKETVIMALKLETAQQFFIHAETHEGLYKPLINAAMFIDSFSDFPMDAGTYIQSMQQRQREMDGFILELLKIERNHPFFWQRVYSLLGIESETKTTSFFEGLKLKLRLGQKPAGSDDYAFRQPVGRLSLD